jgi:hypothetical protein
MPNVVQDIVRCPLYAIVRSDLRLLLCTRNVISTLLAIAILGSLWCMISAPIRNIMSHGRMGCVFCSLCLVLEYSQERIAKNSAPANSCALACSRGCFAFLIHHRYTLGGIAFW